MSEVMKNFAMLLWLACAMNNGTATASAQGIQEEKAKISIPANPPTIVFGKAAQADGSTDEVVVEQPDNSLNPLGNPISDVVESAPQVDNVTEKNTLNTFNENLPKQKNVTPQMPNQKNLGDDFQNTLMEANGMVYDVQAYPIQDLKSIGNTSNPETIYSPNVNP